MSDGCAALKLRTLLYYFYTSIVFEGFSFLDMHIVMI